MREKKNVLIFPAGGENAFNIFDALKYNFHFELFGASMVSNHASFIYDKDHYFEGDLNISSPNFIKTLNSIIKKFKIDFILCTHDEVIEFLMRNKDSINAVICSSPLETVEIASNKMKTAETFRDKYYMPKIYNVDEELEFPLFLKPFVGAGGKGTKLVNSYDEYNSFMKGKKDYLVCEFLPGDEYTIDCFTNKDGKLLFAGARTRERITNGITYRSNRVIDNKINAIAEDINNTLPFRGAWFFQLKKDRYGNYKLMEICVRQGGTMNYYRGYGFNFPSLTLFDFMNQNVIPLINDFNLTLDRCIHNSYKLDYEYDTVYFDFDDTLIIEDKVNTTAIKFLYQCKNSNKKVILLSKHSTNIYEDLEKYCISKDLFNEIFVLKDDEKKVDYIKTKKSIFIDNYFVERYAVKEKYDIPVFDVDAIECLIDDSRI